jgi:hypothetical protein
MAKKTLIGVRLENPAEAALREWFEKQALASPGNLEEAARLLIGLITGLYGLLFTVLAVAGEPLPGYLRLAPVKWLGVLAVVLLMVCLLAALDVVLPQPWSAASGLPASQRAEFEKIVRRKAAALKLAVYAFALGAAALGAALAAALLSV